MYYQNNCIRSLLIHLKKSLSTATVYEENSNGKVTSIATLVKFTTNISDSVLKRHNKNLVPNKIWSWHIKIAFRKNGTGKCQPRGGRLSRARHTLWDACASMHSHYLHAFRAAAAYTCAEAVGPAVIERIRLYGLAVDVCANRPGVRPRHTKQALRAREARAPRNTTATARLSERAGEFPRREIVENF